MRAVARNRYHIRPAHPARPCPRVSSRALARALREAIRLRLTTLGAVGDALGTHRGRRGAGRLAAAVVRYEGLPLERARDRGEDARKQARWGAAGWEVRRLPSDDVYEHPYRLLALASPPSVPR